MQTQTQTSKLLLLCWLYLLAGFFAPSMAQTEPAQIPLTSNAAPVKPNILLMLDTSGSMKYSYIDAPHVIQAQGSWLEAVTNAIGCAGVIGIGLNDEIIPESPYHNDIYYNPAKKYSPGFEDNGSKKISESAFETDDEFSVYLPSSISNLNEKIDQTIFENQDILQICDATNYKKYTLEKPCKYGAFGFCGVKHKYHQFRINNIGYSIGGIFVKFLSFGTVRPTSELAETFNSKTQSPFGKKNRLRDDCSGDVCTLDEERVNIANWKRYHSTRLLAAKTGIGAAFASQTSLPSQSNLFRLGYSNVTTTSAITINPVLDWSAQKVNFYTWLNRLTAGGDTPLRIALNIAGKYFQNGPNTSIIGETGDPFNSDPSQKNKEDDPQLTCRRNHTILVTDGAWNDYSFDRDQAYDNDRSRIGNSDSTAGSIIRHSDTQVSYQYVPGDTVDSRNKGKQDLKSGSERYSLTLADVSHYYWATDLRNNLDNNASPGNPTDSPFWQNMTTHTVGFGTAGELKPTKEGQSTLGTLDQAKAGTLDWYRNDPLDDIKAKLDDLIHAAHNSGGRYLQITDAKSFATQIGTLIEKITAEVFSQAGLAVSSNELASTTKRFIPYFTSGTWWGNLKMQSMDENGKPVAKTGDWQVVTTDATGTPTGSTIPAWATRKVYTWPSGTSASLFSSYTVAPITSDVNAFIRGDRSNEGTLFRKRMSIMGDIVNSTPTFIKNASDFGYELLPSSLAGAGPQYAKYMKDKKARTEGVVFVGANDGMLHGFREGVTTNNAIPGGTEVFAYIPRAVLPKIHELSKLDYSHKFFVDGPITEVDAFISAPTPANSGSKTARWTNMIMGSLGAGGKSVFAIDVTDPLTMNEKSVLWEFDSHADLGFVMGEIQTGVTASGDWVAIFGNGKYSTNGTANLFILNLSDGTLLKKMTASTTSNNGLGTVRLVRNNYNQIIGAYAGDLLGNMWRFDLSSRDKTSWPLAGDKLYTATNTANQVQSISAAPEVIKVYQYTDSNSVLQLTSKATLGVATGYMVTFGTGKLYDTIDQTDTTLQSAYGIWDKSVFGGGVTFAAASKAQLFPVTMGSNTGGTYYSTASTTTTNWNTHRGWYINYVAGQRTIYPFKQYADSVIVNSVIPRAAPASCSANTPEGMNLIVNPLTGLCPVRYLVDTNNDGKIDTSDDPAAVLDTNGDGKIDQSDDKQYCGWVGPVAGPPVFLRRIVTDDVNKVWKMETSTQTPKGQQTGLSDVNLSIKQRDWRQIFPRP